MYFLNRYQETYPELLDVFPSSRHGCPRFGHHPEI